MTKESCISLRKNRTICLSSSKDNYLRIIDNPIKVRRWIDDCYKEMPELFPANFSLGYRMKDTYTSRKQTIKIQRIQLYNKVNYTIRPSFLI